MQSRMLYARPIPVGRIVQSIADRAQTNTQYYGKRPYGVGFLVVGEDVSLLHGQLLNAFRAPSHTTLPSMLEQETGPHLFEFSPTGVFYEYHAHSIGARSQSAKTYLEDHYAEFEDCKPLHVEH